MASRARCASHLCPAAQRSSFFSADVSAARRGLAEQTARQWRWLVGCVRTRPQWMCTINCIIGSYCTCRRCASLHSVVVLGLGSARRSTEVNGAQRKSDEKGSTRVRASGELIYDKLVGQKDSNMISLPSVAAAVLAAAAAAAHDLQQSSTAVVAAVNATATAAVAAAAAAAVAAAAAGGRCRCRRRRPSLLPLTPKNLLPHSLHVHGSGVRGPCGSE